VGVYGYCVVPGGHAIPQDVTGLHGAGVRAHRIDDLAVVISEIDRPEPTAEHVQQHNAAIEGVVTEEVTPVPLRFGQWAPDAGMFDEVVREKAAWYHERLKAFAGALEFGLRAVRPDMRQEARDVRVAPAATGREYMNALRDKVVAQRGHSEEAEQVRQGISEILGAFVREERVEEARTPHGVITVSHLVSRQHFDEYREHAQRLRTRYPDMRFLVSGPWMPYSFAS
jgi:hypothetical protein